MSEKGLCCGLYRGSFYMKDLSDPSGALLPIGNAEASISQTMSEISTPNYQSLGGKACSITQVDKMTLNLTIHCTKPTNLAKAFLGDAVELDSGMVVEEQHKIVSHDQLVAFDYVPLKDGILVEGDGVTYVAGKDYVVTNAGILITEGSSIVLGSNIKVSYSYGKNWVISAHTASQKTFYTVLDGVNVGEGNSRPLVMKVWKLKPAPTDSFSLIAGQEFASINLECEMLIDDSKKSGSKYFQIEFGSESEGLY